MKPGPGRSACVIANGDLPGAAVARRLARDADVIICADGGARHAARLGIRPDVIIGDMDSLSAAHRRRFRDVRILRVRDQESTDLEKALRHCVALGIRSVVVVAAVGDRLDHSTGALGCFRKFRREIRLTLVDRGGTLSHLGPDETVTMARGALFSLIPVGRCTGVRIDGARYPMKGGSLEPGVREGISNRATGKTVRVRHSDGTLLIYRPGVPGRGAPPRPAGTRR